MSYQAWYSPSLSISVKLLKTKVILVFPIRALSSDTSILDLAYPPPDTSVHNYLDISLSTCVEAEIHQLRFLQHLFQEVSAKIDGLCKVQVPTFVELAGSWHKYLEQDKNRTELYDAIIAQCRTDDSVCMTCIIHLFFIHYYWQMELKNMYRGDWDEKDKDCPPSLLLHAESEQAKKELESLLAQISCCCKSPEELKLRLVLYFDEAHVLARGQVSNDPNGKNMYDVLCSCFERLRTSDFPIFAIFVSTHSLISTLAPSASLARSARARHYADGLQAPITETPFDCSPIFPLKIDHIKLQNLWDIQFMAQFGRPM
jgi:hypothetical protein